MVETRCRICDTESMAEEQISCMVLKVLGFKVGRMYARYDCNLLKKSKRLRLLQKKEATMTRFAERKRKKNIKSLSRTVNNHHFTMFYIGWCCSEHHALRDWTFD